ncbi:DUF4870 domain-containing protein [Streptomyces sp. NPDC048644]|uniref:DUF4870 domain-containing protein n=1 Tax=Streptomyces sp. NPDC048644 TaxID=3365582 RepID=UPI0037215948
MSDYHQPGYGYGPQSGPQQPYGGGPGWQSGPPPNGYGYPSAPGYGADPGYGTPPPPPSTSAAMWAHLGALLTVTAGSMMCCGLGAFAGWIGPMSVRGSERNKHDRYVRHHATEALNFGITQALMAVLGAVLYFGTMLVYGLVADEAQRASAGLAIPMLTVIAIMGAYGISGVVCAIIATVKATRGEWWSYPRLIAWPMVKAA